MYSLTASPDPQARHPRQRGDAARQRIIAALLGRTEENLPPPTQEELRATLGGSLTNLRHHLEWLEERQLVRVQDAVREVARKEVVLIDPKERRDGVRR